MTTLALSERAGNMGVGLNGQAITSLELALNAEIQKRKKMSCRYQLLTHFFFFLCALKQKPRGARITYIDTTGKREQTSIFFFLFCFHHSMVRAISPPDVLLGE